MKAIDLFCGAGGASLGLHRAGFDVHGFDYWQPAVDTHNANGMPATLLDLSTENPPGSCELLWASPPCQPFSAAGKGNGEFDGRDGFPWLVRILGAMTPRPPVVVVENVKGLTFAKHADYLAAVLAGITAFGYDAQWKVLNAADYGVPQTRERCIIIARRDGGTIAWPTPTHSKHDGMLTRRWVTMAEALGWGMTESPFPTIPAASGSGGPRLDGVGGSGARRFVAAERYAGRWILNYRQTSRDGKPITCDVTDRPSPTVGTMASSQWVVEPGPIRLTIPELATLQGFPPDWTWTGTKTAQARQVGNAVPPALAHAIAAANLPTELEVAA